MHLWDVKFKGACDGLDYERKCEDSETICEAVFRTNQQTCDKHCEKLGLVCEDGWNDISGTCHKSSDASGCNVGQWTQICRCKTGKSSINYLIFLRIFSI